MQAAAITARILLAAEAETWHKQTVNAAVPAVIPPPVLLQPREPSPG